MKTDFIQTEFICRGKKLSNGPKAGMSLLSASSMRFRWNEINCNRDLFLNEISADKITAPVELIHSKTVYAVDSALDLYLKKGDGIITVNRELMPVITVADCMPIFIYDPVSGVFGVLHSGWKGTGIVCAAIEKAGEVYGAKASDFCVILGPHIHDCCYLVDKERADYFSENFTPECVKKAEGKEGLYALSLARANLELLHRAGLRDDNIFVSKECTACTKYEDGSFKYGSFRRQAGSLSKEFTVQAAWITWDN